jgi:hypothetical protein
VLARKGYSSAYVAACRARCAAQVALFSGPPALEVAFFNDLLIVLEMSFVHRMRGQEGKDGNALNEVRMLTESLLENDGVLQGSSTIRYRPEASVLGLEIGDQIRLSAGDVTALAAEFFAQLVERFPSGEH